MAIQKPSIPKGTRDFGVSEMVKRNYIFNIIRSVFQLFGFKPIETPAVENLSTLLGKYGEEGDRLIFKILDSGEFIEKIPIDELGQKFLDNPKSVESVLALIKDFLKEFELNIEDFDSIDWNKYIPVIGERIGSKLENLTWKDIEIYSNEIAPYITEKALRYDLTVPFARFVVMHQNEITFPFKRYQIQPVWRADRPQKGRYREFFQCDVDVIGSNSLINEFELIQIVDQVFSQLKIAVVIKLNNRKILTGIAEVIGEAEKIIDITVAIDKLDKIGLEGVNKELLQKGISENAIAKLQPIIQLSGNSEQKLNILKGILKDSPSGLLGITEVETIFEYLKTTEIKSEVEFDLTLARGLNYYTGAIFEVKAKDMSMGSIAGGGRYDDLTGIFGLPGVSGVGISFGADRIYDVLNELNLFPENAEGTTQLLFINFGPAEEKYCLPLLAETRKKGICAELYPSSAKMKKQLDYANSYNIPYVAIVGSDEMNSNTIMLKNMNSGEQNKVTLPDLIKLLKA